MTTPIKLKHLTLQSRSLTSFSLPDLNSEEYKQFCLELEIEGNSILNNANWKDKTTWSKGLVDTFSLYHNSFEIIDHDHEGIEVEKGEGDHDVTQTQTVKKSSFWRGGGSNKVKSNKEIEKEADKGFAFHMRDSIHSTDLNEGGFNYESYFETLAIHHAEQEVEYVTTLARVSRIVKENSQGQSIEAFLKLYNLPFPTTNRSFFTHIVIHSPSPTPNPTDSSAPYLRSFFIFSLPVSPEPELTENLDTGFVRGKYVSVEEIREIVVDGQIKIQWRLASMSTAGGKFSFYRNCSIRKFRSNYCF